MSSDTQINNALVAGSTKINNAINPDRIALIGDILLGKYTIREKLLVSSGEANLYICSYNRRHYVAKIYKREQAIKSEVVDVLKSIKSDYIAPIIDTGEWNSLPVEILPFYKKGSLQGKKYSYEELKNLIIPELNEGLHILHTNKIIHKDLKPSNIMLKDDGQNVVIIDFGISSVREAGNTMVITRTGLTPEYMANEAFRNTFFDITDYYSLGITIYELYYGHVPYAGMSQEEIEQFIAVQRIPFPKSIPEELEQLITALTYPDITNRKNKNNPNRRWSYEEVKKWCAGEKQVIPGSGQEAGVLEGDILPYKFNGKTYSSNSKLVMAMAMNWEEGKKQLFRGFLSEHYKKFDPELAGYCLDAEEDVANNNTDLVFFKTIYKLDKALTAFIWRGKYFLTLPEFGDRLLDALSKNNSSFLSNAEEVLKYKLLTEYANIMEIDEKSKEYLALSSIEKRYKHGKSNLIQDLYYLGYVLSDKKPLIIDDKEFYSIDEFVHEVQLLENTDKSKLKKLGRTLIIGDGQLNPQFNAWLLANGMQEKVAKWESTLR